MFAPQRLALAGHEARTAECVHPLPRGGSAQELPWPRTKGMEPDVRERKGQRGPKTLRGRWVGEPISGLALLDVGRLKLFIALKQTVQTRVKSAADVRVARAGQGAGRAAAAPRRGLGTVGRDGGMGCLGLHAPTLHPGGQHHLFTTHHASSTRTLALSTPPASCLAKPYLCQARDAAARRQGASLQGRAGGGDVQPKTLHHLGPGAKAGG